MAHVEVGTAYVTIMPTTKGFVKNIVKSLGGAGLSGGRKAGLGFVSGLDNIVKGSAIGTMLGNAFSQAAGAISSSIGAAVGRVDALNNYPKVMVGIGAGADEAKRSISLMSDKLSTLPTRLDAMTGTVQGLYAAGKKYGIGLGTITKAGLALNDMMLAGGQGPEIASAATEQFRQILAKGKPELQDWKSLISAAPGQMNQLARSMLGPTATADDLYKALGGGGAEATLSMNDLLDAIVRLDEEGGEGFESFSKQAESATGGIQTSALNMMNAINRGVASVIQAIGPESISAILGGIKGLINDIFGAAVNAIEGFKQVFDLPGFAKLFGGFADAFMKGFGVVPDATNAGRDFAAILNGWKPALELVTPLFGIIGTVLRIFGDVISTVLTAALKFPVLFIALFVGLKFVFPIIKSLVTGFLRMQPPIASSGKSAGESAAKLAALGIAAAGIGAGIWLVAQAFSTLANTAIMLTQAGAPAIAIFAGMAIAIVGLIAGLIIAAPVLQANTAGLLAFGGAVLMTGAGVLLIATGISILADSMIRLSEAGGIAVPLFGAIAAGIGIAIVAIALLSPVLTASAVGLVAFGVGVALVGAGVFLATAGLAILATQLPTIAAFGASAAGAIVLLGGSLVVFSVGALLGGVGATVLGAGLIVMGAGAVVAAVGVAALSVAALLLAAAFAATAAGVAIIAAGMAVIAPALMASATASAALAPALVLLAASAVAAGAAMTAASPLFLLFGIAAGGAADGTRSLGDAASKAAAGLSGTARGITSANAATGAFKAGVSSAASATDMFGASLTCMPSALTTASAGFQMFSERVRSSMLNAVSYVQGAMNQMAAAVSRNLTIPTIRVRALPHFSMSGKFDPQTGSVPKVSVSYYARGGIFKRAAIFGEAGTEAVVPYNERGIQPLASGIAKKLGSNDADEVISWLARNLGAIIAENAPTATPREFGNMVNRVVMAR